jgi:hypothetical protein
VKWFDDEREPLPFLMALVEIRHLSTRKGWRCQHVQANIVSIDKYAEAATGNREYFLNKPHSCSAIDVNRGTVHRGNSHRSD